ncbi:MAG: ABC transporter permease [Culturomica sp.]|jgi:lipoprotein-releasing system permease protein|nr:ABC transporter permease [Culturomica sp.]
MRLSLFIAGRYLFSRKKQHAINIISGISVLGVTVGVSALIAVLSVFNGMEVLLAKSMDSLTPDLVISPESGKFMPAASALLRKLGEREEIAYYQPVIEEKALLKYGERIMPVTVKGVPESFDRNTGFREHIVRGNYGLKNGDIYFAAVGAGIARELGIGLSFLTPMTFYYPDNSSSRIQTALHTEYLFPAALFSVQQELDDKLVIADIGFARNLFLLEEGEVSRIEIKLGNPAGLSRTKAVVSEIAAGYRVEDKFERDRAFYAMMRSEKLVVFLILLFILLIASFNIVGSISMLILDKKEDLGVYAALGMRREKLISVFRTEGMLITAAGVLAGTCLGVLLCYLQERYGLIGLGDGNYITAAYPVKVVAADVALVILCVLLIGYIASYFPVKYLIRRLIGSSDFTK